MIDQANNPYAAPQCEPLGQAYPSKTVDNIGITLFILGPSLLSIGLPLGLFEPFEMIGFAFTVAGFVSLALLAAIIKSDPPKTAK